MFILVDTTVIILIYIGFRKEKSVAALAAVGYGILAIIVQILEFRISFTSYLALVGVSALVAGIIALKENGLY
jgi:hypothetical protein